MVYSENIKRMTSMLYSHGYYVTLCNLKQYNLLLDFACYELIMVIKELQKIKNESEGRHDRITSTQNTGRIAVVS